MPEDSYIEQSIRSTEYDTISNAFRLREEVNRLAAQQLDARKRTNPEKSQLEQDLGVYIEELDPQVRDAVIRMHALGYTTFASGFWGDDHHQIIQGEFRLDPKTKAK